MKQEIRAVAGKPRDVAVKRRRRYVVCTQLFVSLDAFNGS